MMDAAPPPTFSPGSPDYVQRVHDSFAQQAFMRTLGVRIVEVAPGTVTLALPFRADLTQQDGFLHAGVTASLADSAAGYAAYTTMPPDSRVLSIEFKHNLLAPAVGESFEARGQVIRAGKTIVVVQATVSALRGGQAKAVAQMQATMMRVEA
ncbi:PaaI family thioesterase [Roseospira goensis]|uniref:Medium/long-chain acyl-CoA thioesterase YigI n=1 Tax=Roseospira goensis TaxID=391922 RepID=A0A7W6S255_9PROT|nr:PaaI family thioesterase [Roseospira goensis]MBB4287020.1 uncharacterized protein (TIGR00369 family) [Roseospira goensis]